MSMSTSREIEVSSQANLEKIARESLPEEILPPETIPFPAAASEIRPTSTEKIALRLLAARSGEIQVTTRRLLDDDELKSLFAEASAMSMVIAYVERRRRVVGVIVRQHADVQAESSGIALSRPQTRGGIILTPATERTTGGNYQLAAPQKPYRINVPGTGRAWSLEYKAGATSVSAEKLAKLLADGEVSRQEYLAFTEPPRPQERVLSPDRALSFIRKNNERGMEILQKITEQGLSSASLNVRASSSQG